MDVNALVALAWDFHVHHGAIRTWFADKSSDGGARSPTTESGFVRVSANPKVLPSPVTIDAARQVLTALRDLDSHRFLVDNVSPTDADVPRTLGHRQVTAARLLTLARRHGSRLITFDAGIAALAEGRDVELLVA